MMKVTQVEMITDDTGYRRFEHPTRGTVETVSYPGGIVFVANGFKRREPAVEEPPRPKRSAGGKA
jgi:hypothetical protein